MTASYFAAISEESSENCARNPLLGHQRTKPVGSQISLERTINEQEQTLTLGANSPQDDYLMRISVHIFSA